MGLNDLRSGAKIFNVNVAHLARLGPRLGTTRPLRASPVAYPTALALRYEARTPTFWKNQFHEAIYATANSLGLDKDVVYQDPASL